MGHEQIRHDVAYSAATKLLELAAPWLQPEERKGFHRQAYEVTKAAIETFHDQKNREATRLSMGRS